MTTITLLALPREEVLTYLDTWPPAPGTTVVRVDPAGGVTDGAVMVYTTPGRPGVTWWMVDGLIPPQGAGAGGEELAALIPGATVEQVPDQDGGAPSENTDPPYTPPPPPSYSPTSYSTE